MVLAWLACATVGAVGVTTNTKSVVHEARVLRRQGSMRCRDHPTAICGDGARSGAGDSEWTAVTGDDSGEAAGACFDGCEPFDALFARTPPVGPDGRSSRCCRSASCSPRARRAVPKRSYTRTQTRSGRLRTGPGNIDLGPDDRYLIYLPFFHVNAQCWSFFSVLGAGATAVLMPKWSTSRFWDVVTRHGITHISLLPFVFPALQSPDRPAGHTLRVGVFGLVSDQLDAMLGLSVYAAFGMTETVTHSIVGKPDEQLPMRSMGHVAPGYEIAVVDKETGNLCAAGEPGELWLRGTRGIQLFLEYFDNPEANDAAFDGAWFKTGDVVRMGAGGNVFYQERDKDLLKVGGENVSGREVEDVVGTVPGVAQVAAVGRHHEFLDQVVVAFVVAAPGAPDAATLEAQVIAACTERLASFKVPRAVYVVDAFPVGTLDKILKNKLREMADAMPPLGHDASPASRS